MGQKVRPSPEQIVLKTISYCLCDEELKAKTKEHILAVAERQI